MSKITSALILYLPNCGTWRRRRQSNQRPKVSECDIITMSKLSDMKLSKKLQHKASRLMPDGVANSIFVKKARGSHIWDVDGNEYIDYRLGWGPVILGHGHRSVQKKVHEYDKNGICYALDNPLEITVGQKIKSLVPGAEIIRYFVTGTEATMHAIRIARAFTKKDRVLKFDGHYHGANDYALFSVDPSPHSPLDKPQPASQGIPNALKELVIISQWNDFNAVEKAIKKEASNTAAIITEPIMANAAVIPPLDGYLAFLKELCEKNDDLLIFDEVKTGFRVAKGGAQQLFGVKPHMTTFAKALGNGYPISAVVTLDEIKRAHVHSNIEKFGNALIKGMREVLQDKGIENAIIQGYPSMFQVLFTKQGAVNNYRDFLSCNNDQFSKLQECLMTKGIMLDENNSEPLYTSVAHNNNDLKNTLEA